MQKLSIWKILSTIIFTAAAIIFVMPNFVDDSDWLPGDKVSLGLDLRGGSHLLLDVDFESYLDEISQTLAESVRKYMRENKIGYKNIKVERNHVRFDLRNEDSFDKVKKIISGIDRELNVSRNEMTVSLSYSEYSLNQLQDKVIDQSIEIIRMRVDSTGTKEPILQRQGNTHILLQVPGEQDPSGLKRVIGQTAKMTFHLVDETANLASAAKGVSPAGTIIVEDEREGSVLVVKKRSIITGEMLNNAQATFNQNSQPVVRFSLNSIGAKKFAEATSKNHGRRMAIVLDGKSLSSPRINEPIISGDGIITGSFTVESANELALLLRAGALPAPLKIVEERSIGPNLGADSIEAGKIAAGIGFVLVIIFMILFYGIFGLFANITLVLALIYILALLSMLQATLTLPGIAGIILTIGMAVDANVLIYERIKEEVRKGNSNLYAIKLGFESAFATITDSNVTTLIAAFLLYVFGVGAIKGFAVTLTIGIISSMFTALVVTKLMIDLWMRFVNPKKLGL